MYSEERKNRMIANLQATIEEAELLISRCENALVDIESVFDEISAKEFDEKIGKHIEDGFKHIELF